MKLQFTEQAVHDIVRLREFIAEKNPKAAKHIGDQLIEHIERVVDQPQLDMFSRHYLTYVNGWPEIMWGTIVYRSRSSLSYKFGMAKRIELDWFADVCVPDY